MGKEKSSPQDTNQFYYKILKQKKKFSKKILKKNFFEGRAGCFSMQFQANPSMIKIMFIEAGIPIQI